MCIRDREQAFGELVEDAQRQGIALLRTPAGFSFAPAREGAVSYTHLRAHETVLDIVCRILLETKQHNKKITQSRY